ncbi:MAG: hypothetical protein HY670_08615 [Chloroflexi bacterium]|nr:hypothetical protein [Chloroflexota bacterium]
MKIIRCLCVTAFVEQGKLDDVVGFWRDVMGSEIGPEMSWLFKYGHRARNTRVLGMDSPFSVELAECYDETKPIGKQAKRFAPCFHALTYQVENVDDCIAELKAKGVNVSEKLVMDYPGFEVDGKKDTVYECMIHPKSAYGLVFELIQFDKSPWWYGLEGEKAAK